MSALTSEQLARIAELERRFKAGEMISMVESLEYTGLKAIARRMAGPPELADDPSTPFTDESSRPQLDGSNYNDTLHRMTCAEVEAIFVRVGRVAFDAAVAAVLKGR